MTWELRSSVIFPCRLGTFFLSLIALIFTSVYYPLRTSKVHYPFDLEDILKVGATVGVFFGAMGTVYSEAPVLYRVVHLAFPVVTDFVLYSMHLNRQGDFGFGAVCSAYQSLCILDHAHSILSLMVAVCLVVAWMVTWSAGYIVYSMD
ncbi:MAG: hypothetical protein J3R72DRAFT_429089, partial [Linnemannia gamsii]